VFAGIMGGIELDEARENTVEGNLFGLAADGTTSVALSDSCVDLLGGSCGNLIGGLASVSVICR